MAEVHPAVTNHLPMFITPPGDTDVLMVVAGVFLVLAVMSFGILFLRLHSLPERLAHKSQKIQFEIVAVLCLIALFSHMHIFWIAALLLAMIDFPDFGTSLNRIAGSAEKIAGIRAGEGTVGPSHQMTDTVEHTVDLVDVPSRANAKERHGDDPVVALRSEAVPPRRRSVLEFLVCSLVTIVPDYLYRRYRQGKRLGKEITFYSVWFELRWGITACVILTLSLITVIFYNHPSTTNATLFFRTIPILPETNGRVAEIFVGVSGPVAKGAPIFKLDSSKQEAAVETARRKIVEIEASLVMARAEIQKTEGQLQEAKGSYQQAKDELATKQELHRRNPGIVPLREIEKLEVRVEATQGTVAAVTATGHAAEVQVATVIPAEKASAEAQLAQALVELEKTVVRAGVNGRVEQFFLRVGDVVNPLMRPAGILIPEGAGYRGLQAGFGQIEAQIMTPGMIAEVTCVSKPWTIIPMVVTSVQDFIAAGQFRGGEQLLEAQQAVRSGTLLVFLEPLYQGGLEGVTPRQTRSHGNAATTSPPKTLPHRTATQPIGSSRRHEPPQPLARAGHWKEVGSSDAGLHSSQHLESQTLSQGNPFPIQIISEPL